MSEVSPEAVAYGFLRAFNEHDVNRAMEYYADEFHWEDVPLKLVVTEHEVLSDLYRQWFDSVPDMHLEPVFVSAAPQGVGVRMAFTGTYLRHVPGIPEDAVLGSAIDVPFASVLEFDDRLKIVGQYDYYSLVDLFGSLQIKSIVVDEWA